MKQIIETIKKSIIEISNEYQKSYDLGYEINNQNKSGDSQKKLDIVADRILTQNLLRVSSVRAIASEEIDNLLWVNTDANYLVVFDPLDGSKNIELNLITGTIFGIFDFSDNTINGSKLLCSGYALYGPTTQMVLTMEQGLILYQLSNDKFKKIRDLKRVIGKNYHINSSKELLWDDKTKMLVKNLNENNYNSRWFGCMVADIHNIILKGGIFLYPGNSKDRQGKIRLLYEAMPMAFIAKTIGGISDDFNNKNILDYKVELNNLHQKIPIKIKI